MIAHIFFPLSALVGMIVTIALLTMVPMVLIVIRLAKTVPATPQRVHGKREKSGQNCSSDDGGIAEVFANSSLMGSAEIQRRERDSNPRNVHHVYTISSRVPSATRTSLQGAR